MYLKYIQCAKMCKNVQKRAKTCISSTYLSKNVHLKVSFTKKRAKTCKNVQKRVSQMFLDPFQQRALSRSVHLEAVHLEAVYLEALLYFSLWKWIMECIGNTQIIHMDVTRITQRTMGLMPPKRVINVFCYKK